MGWAHWYRRSDIARDSKGITQFYLPPTHEPYLPLLPNPRASPPFGWYSLRLPTEGWPGWVDLSDWLYTETDFPHWELNPRHGPNPSTHRTRRRLTSLIETKALTTAPNRQPVARDSNDKARKGLGMSQRTYIPHIIIVCHVCER